MRQTPGTVGVGVTVTEDHVDEFFGGLDSISPTCPTGPLPLPS